MRRRSFSRRPKRGGRPVGPFTNPKRWEAANFNTFIQQDVLQDPFLGTTVMIELMAHPFHVGDMATGQGQTLTDMVSKIEIGGVVFDIDVFVVNVEVTDTIALFHFTEFLATIELDAGGNPVVVPDYFQNQKPVAIASINNIVANDTDFPTRTHYRSSYSEIFPREDSTTRVVRSRERPGFTKSLRLKRYLSQRQGLYLGVCALQNFIDPTGIFFVRFSGTVYYRIRF